MMTSWAGARVRVSVAKLSQFGWCGEGGVEVKIIMDADMLVIGERMTLQDQ